MAAGGLTAPAAAQMVLAGEHDVGAVHVKFGWLGQGSDAGFFADVGSHVPIVSD